MHKFACSWFFDEAILVMMFSGCITQCDISCNFSPISHRHSLFYVYGISVCRPYGGTQIQPGGSLHVAPYSVFLSSFFLSSHPLHRKHSCFDHCWCSSFSAAAVDGRSVDPEGLPYEMFPLVIHTPVLRV